MFLVVEKVMTFTNIPPIHKGQHILLLVIICLGYIFPSSHVHCNSFKDLINKNSARIKFSIDMEKTLKIVHFSNSLCYNKHTY